MCNLGSGLELETTSVEVTFFSSCTYVISAIVIGLSGHPFLATVYAAGFISLCFDEEEVDDYVTESEEYEQMHDDDDDEIWEIPDEFFELGLSEFAHMEIMPSDLINFLEQVTDTPTVKPQGFVEKFLRRCNILCFKSEGRSLELLGILLTSQIKHEDIERFMKGKEEHFAYQTDITSATKKNKFVHANYKGFLGLRWFFQEQARRNAYSRENWIKEGRNFFLVKAVTRNGLHLLSNYDFCEFHKFDFLYSYRLFERIAKISNEHEDKELKFLRAQLKGVDLALFAKAPPEYQSVDFIGESVRYPTNFPRIVYRSCVNHVPIMYFSNVKNSYLNMFIIAGSGSK